jgi:hypothetical protein
MIMKNLGPNPLLAAMELRQLLCSDAFKPDANLDYARTLVGRIVNDLCRLPQSREWNDEYYGR